MGGAAALRTGLKDITNSSRKIQPSAKKDVKKMLQLSKLKLQEVKHEEWDIEYMPPKEERVD